MIQVGKQYIRIFSVIEVVNLTLCIYNLVLLPGFPFNLKGYRIFDCNLVYFLARTW